MLPLHHRSRSGPTSTPIALAVACLPALLAALHGAPAAAQNVREAEAAPRSEAPAEASRPAAGATATVIVTGNPLKRDVGAQPVQALAGDELLQRRGATLGATLDALPGLASTGFGPNASRPVIRGLDGDRVRVLDNGGASFDASALSFDHAVPIDPLVVERLEVLRGPAALLYGGNAVGGVVSTIDNRIPRAALDGSSGRAEVRFGGAAAERSAAALVEFGGGGWATHVDAFGRRTDDLRVPGGRVANSASEARGGAVGAAWTDREGYAGLAVDTQRRDYGIVVEPDVTIRMRRDRVAFGLERRLDLGAVDRLEIQASRTRYAHDEVEGDGEVGTRFRTTGSELRLQARHRPLAGWQGVVGFQGEWQRFDAQGEEAFVPPTRSATAAAFLLEEVLLGPARLTLGGRVERVTVRSDGAGAGASAEAVERFGAASERRYSPLSTAAALEWPLGAGWRAGVQLGRTERAPASYELYANGLHLATAAFEIGDPTLAAESSRHLGATVMWRGGGSEVKASLFGTRFRNYIALDATGRDVETADGEAVPEYRFRAVRAKLSGGEVQLRRRLAESPWRLTLVGSADVVRGTNLDRGEPLPRLAPWRAQLGLEAEHEGLSLGVMARHAGEQRRVPATDTPTPGYRQLDLWARWKSRLAGLEATWFARADNLTDRLAYNASAAATVRRLSPLPGRSLAAGLQVSM